MLKKTIDVPDTIKANGDCTFRAARYTDIFLHLAGIKSFQIPPHREIPVYCVEWGVDTFKEIQKHFAAVVHLPLGYRNMDGR